MSSLLLQSQGKEDSELKDNIEQMILKECKAILYRSPQFTLKAVELANALRSNVGTDILGFVRNTWGGLLSLLEQSSCRDSFVVQREPKNESVSLIVPTDDATNTISSPILSPITHTLPSHSHIKAVGSPSLDSVTTDATNNSVEDTHTHTSPNDSSKRRPLLIYSSPSGTSQTGSMHSHSGYYKEDRNSNSTGTGANEIIHHPQPSIPGAQKAYNTTDEDDLPPCRCLHIGNLPPNLSENQLLAEFEQFGNVINIKVVTNSKGNRRFAFVTYSTLEVAIAAKARMCKIQTWKNAISYARQESYATLLHPHPQSSTPPLTDAGASFRTDRSHSHSMLSSPSPNASLANSRNLLIPSGGVASGLPLLKKSSDSHASYNPHIRHSPSPSLYGPVPGVLRPYATPPPGLSEAPPAHHHHSQVHQPHAGYPGQHQVRSGDARGHAQLGTRKVVQQQLASPPLPFQRGTSPQLLANPGPFARDVRSPGLHLPRSPCPSSPQIQPLHPAVLNILWDPMFLQTHLWPACEQYDYPYCSLLMSILKRHGGRLYITELSEAINTELNLIKPILLTPLKALLLAYNNIFSVQGDFVTERSSMGFAHQPAMGIGGSNPALYNTNNNSFQAHNNVFASRTPPPLIPSYHTNTSTTTDNTYPHLSHLSSDSTLKNFSMDAAPGNLPLHRPIPVTRTHPTTTAVGTAIDGFSSTYLHSSILDALSSCSIDNNHLTTNNNNTFNTNNFPSTNYTNYTHHTHTSTDTHSTADPTQVISRQHSRSIDNGKGGPGTDFPGTNHLKDMFDFDFEEEEEEEVDTEVFI